MQGHVNTKRVWMRQRECSAQQQGNKNFLGQALENARINASGKDASLEPRRPHGDRLWPIRFGHPDLTNFGQSIFGQSNFGRSNQSNWIWCVSWSKRWGRNPEKSGPEGWGVGPRRVGAQNFALFFPSPAPIFFHCRWRLHTTVREPKRAHLTAPVFTKTTKIQREDTQ